MMDLIERQAAIDALDVGAELLRRVLDETDVVGDERTKYEWGLGLIESCISDMKDLPSAQPDHSADVGNMDDGELDFVQKHEKIPAELRVSKQLDRDIPKKPNEVIDKAWGIPNRQAVCPNCGADMRGEHED